MASTPRSTPPTAARLAALSARYGSAADAEATRASLLAVLSRGRAVPNSPSPVPTHACPEAEACDTEGLVLEFVSIEVERGERCPLLLCRAAPTSAPTQGTELRPNPNANPNPNPRDLDLELPLTLVLTLTLTLTRCNWARRTSG